jgi:hypothetical protein
MQISNDFDKLSRAGLLQKRSNPVSYRCSVNWQNHRAFRFLALDANGLRTRHFRKRTDKTRTLNATVADRLVTILWKVSRVKGCRFNTLIEQILVEWILKHRWADKTIRIYAKKMAAAVATQLEFEEEIQWQSLARKQMDVVQQIIRPRKRRASPSPIAGSRRAVISLT